MSNDFNFINNSYTPTNNFEFEVARRILAGTSSRYTSVRADLDANIYSGLFYVATAGTGASFSVIDSANGLLKDSYTLIEEGLREEPLEREDIVDINVG